MTAKALEILEKNENGFVLLVEGGRIDSAHHETVARLALDEAKEFQNTVEFVRGKTNEEETLIVVTADHSTVLSVGGYMVSQSLTLSTNERIHEKLRFIITRTNVNNSFKFPASRLQHPWPRRFFQI